MVDPVATRAKNAQEAREEKITLFVHDPEPQVVRGLLENPNLSEEHILILASRKNLPAEILAEIFRDKRWSESYPVKLALAKNPKTPLFTALSVARFLQLFDLSDLARNHQLSVLYRKKVEAIVIEKIPTLPLGVKKTLAKVCAGDILLALIQDGYPEVVKVCLDNPSMVEAHLHKVINRKTTTAGTIRTIAEHRAWCCRYQIKFALIRNEHTPLSRSVLLLADMKLYDLVELYRNPLLPHGVRPAIHRELLERGQDPERLQAPHEERVYEVDEKDADVREHALTEEEEPSEGNSSPLEETSAPADQEPSGGSTAKQT